MLEIIRKAWKWAGLDPVEIIQVNAFGNLLVRAVDGSVWRICPEELACEKIASDLNGLKILQRDGKFRVDWEMAKLVVLAEGKLGLAKQGYCYCFKIPPAIGGGYELDNMGEISLEELIAFSGDIAEQIKDVPDGTPIEIKLIP